MSGVLPLRPYQREAIDAVKAAWRGGMQRPSVVIPTGTGKTVLFSHLVSEFTEETGGRAVVLVHRDELADQALNKIRSTAPHLSVGKVKAADDEADARVVVASVQTLARKRRMSRLRAAGPVGLVVCDEVHHYASRTFRRVLEELGCFSEGGAKMLGVTATLARADGVGLGGIVEDVVYTRSILWAIKNGFLVEPTGISVAVEGLDLAKLRKSAGDYGTGALGEALSESGTMAVAAAAYVEYGQDRPGVVFTPTVATAHEAMKELELRGVPSAVVSGETPREERLRIFRDYRDGVLKVLANCMVLTEGWDAPWAEVAVIARPTQSQPLYTQMVGRILRPFPGKEQALILDLVGASRDNRLKTLIDLEEGIFPELRLCDDCRRLPCTCTCDGCGELRRACTCPKETPSQELKLAGSGGALELFAASSTAWLQTRKGIWFIPCGTEGEVLLWPEEGGKISVAHAPQHGPWRKLRSASAQGLELTRAWAEVEAEELGGVLTRRRARWRKAPASDAQTSHAVRLGVPVTPGINKGDLGDLISVFHASGKIDPFVKE